MVSGPGIEPGTFWMSTRCSSAELPRLLRLRRARAIVNPLVTGLDQPIGHLDVVFDADVVLVPQLVNVRRAGLLRQSDVPSRDGSGPSSSDGLSCGPSYRLNICCSFFIGRSSRKCGRESKRARVPLAGRPGGCFPTRLRPAALRWYQVWNTCQARFLRIGQ